MTDLDELLAVARTADPGERIEFRDAIAAHGGRAIPPMTAWISEPELGAFATRVLARIADDPSERGAVLAAFASVDAAELSGPIALDVSEEIGRIRGASRNPGARSKAAGTDPWPGNRAVTDLELRFHDSMLEIFTLAGEATRKVRPDGSKVRGYWASYFLRGVRNNGGPAYAHQLLRAQGTSDGFQRLTDEDRLDLTVEALVLRPEYDELFSDDERRIASDRLARAGYQPKR